MADCKDIAIHRPLPMGATPLATAEFGNSWLQAIQATLVALFAQLEVRAALQVLHWISACQLSTYACVFITAFADVQKIFNHPSFTGKIDSLVNHGLSMLSYARPTHGYDEAFCLLFFGHSMYLRLKLLHDLLQGRGGHLEDWPWGSTYQATMLYHAPLQLLQGSASD